MRLLLVVLVLACCAVLPAPASAARCSGTVRGEVSAFNITTRNTGCTRARQVARAYVKLRSCRPSCVASRFRCRGSSAGETGDVIVRCTRHRRVVRFNLG